MQPQHFASTVKSNQSRVTTATWIKRLGAVMLSGMIMALGLIAPQLVRASHTAGPAAQLVVNTAVDENDGSCSDGDCSLRDAIAVAANGDNIIFAGNYSIYLNSTLNINKDLTVDGSGYTIKISGDSGGNGSPNVRVFYIDSSGVVTLTHLGIISGTIAGDGGGIYNQGTLTVQNSTLSSNSATNYGGGLYNGGPLTVQNSTFSDNSAGHGGGLYSSRPLIVRNSTFSSNSTTGYGGGIANDGVLTLQNSTFSDSSASYGGGIFNGNGTLTIQHTTLAGNSAINSGGGIYHDQGTLHLSNTLISDSSSGGDCAKGSGTVATNDHNLIESVGVHACGLTNGAGGSLIGVDPLLGQLADNGGGTQTLALLPDSPAIDAGNNVTCLATDQRGVARPQGAACDIGAYEVERLSLMKFVMPETPVLYHGAVTYTLLLNPGNVSTDTNIILTDTLPAPVVFGSWVISPANTMRVGNTITWTGTLTRSRAITFTFTAMHIGGYGDVITNVAYFSSTQQAGRASAVFTVSPQMIVLGNDVAIADGDTTPSPIDGTDFGHAAWGEALTHTFTLSNSGWLSLTVNSLGLSGPAAGHFALSGLTTPVTLTANSTRTFQVRFTPTSVGKRMAAVTITNTGNDGDQNVYDFAIQGIGLCASQLQVTNANDAGPGSLRQAIADAVDGDTIAFVGDYTIYLSSQLMVSKTLTIDGCNYAPRVNGNGGGRIFFIDNSGIVTLTHLSILNGSSNQGGGIYNSGTLAVINSTFSSNSAYCFSPNCGHGGGIFNNGGTLAVINSTFSDNSAYCDVYYCGNGGGIYNNGGMLTVTNSTFSGNWAQCDGEYCDGGNGGGIYNNGGTLTARSSTFSGNSARCTWFCTSYGGGIYGTGSVMTMRNSLIASSEGGNCFGGPGGSTNLADDDTCGGSFTNSSSILLGALGNYGGDTPTFPLQPGSAAIDTGDAVACPASDQRGVTRPQGAACDIGAYEVAKLSLTKLVTPATPVPYHGVVTYTLILALGQGDAVVDPNIILTDTLPDHVVFNSWVVSPVNTLQAGQSITWTGALTAGQAITFTFTAIHAGGWREWVTNTAYLSATTWVGSALAGFQVTAYAITPTVGGGGTITPSTLQVVNTGESCAFTIIPDPGYHILDVGVDGVSVGAVSVYTFTNVTADHTISATFSLNEYTLTGSVVGQGQVNRTPDQATYLHGSIVTLTALPEAGWYFGQWTGDASGVLTQTTVLMNANKVVTATFFNVPQTYYTLTLSLIGSGLITPTVGAHTYLSGTVVPLSASPEVGWQFAGWSGDVDCVDGSVMMNVNKLCTATFARYQLYLPLILK